MMAATGSVKVICLFRTGTQYGVLCIRSSASAERALPFWPVFVDGHRLKNPAN
jgi:hypothetical protein